MSSTWFQHKTLSAGYKNRFVFRGYAIIMLCLHLTWNFWGFSFQARDPEFTVSTFSNFHNPSLRFSSVYFISALGPP